LCDALTQIEQLRQESPALTVLRSELMRLFYSQAPRPGGQPVPAPLPKVAS
jgi:hypothetical protein